MDNLAREVREETGLSITSTPRLIGAQDIFVGSERHVVRLTYTAHAEGEAVLDLSENTDFKWCSFDELCEEELLDTYVRKLIESGNLHAGAWVKE